MTPRRLIVKIEVDTALPLTAFTDPKKLWLSVDDVKYAAQVIDVVKVGAEAKTRGR